MTFAPDAGRVHSIAQSPGSLLWLAALPILALVGSTIGVVCGLRDTKLTMLGIALVSLCIGLVPIIVNQARPAARRGIIFSMLSIWFALTFVTPVFTNYIHVNGLAIPGNMSGERIALRDIVGGQWTALLGLCALLLGNYLPIGRRLAQALPPPQRDWSRGVIIAVALLMLAIGWPLFLAGMLNLIPERAGNGFLGALTSGMIFANVLLTIAAWRHRSQEAILLLAIAVPLTALTGFFGGSKEFFLQAPAMVGITVMTLRGRIGARWIVAGIAVLILIYPTMIFIRETILLEGRVTMLSSLRNVDVTTKRIKQFTSGGSLADRLQQGFEAAGNRLDGLGVASLLVRDTPRVSPFQNGRTLGLFFVAFVPRIVWPSKPVITIGRWLTKTYTSSLAVNSWLAPTAVGDFFINFGYSGVFGGMLLLGLILRFADESLLARQRTAPMILSAVVILYKLAIGIEGNIGYTWSSAVFALAPIAVTHVALRLLGFTIPIQNSSVAGAPEPAGAAF